MINYVERAERRVLLQYKQATKFLEWIGILPSIVQGTIEQPAQAVADVLDLRTRKAGSSTSLALSWASPESKC